MNHRAMIPLVLGTLMVIIVVLSIHAQVREGWYGFGRSHHPPRLRPAGHLDEGFSFCRLMYESRPERRRDGRWSTDYPFADINFMIRFSEMTTTHVNFDGKGEPNHWVVPNSDDSLFGCPFIIGSAVGSMSLNPEAVLQLRKYLLKGGFLWVDDFWGTQEWEQ